MSNMISLIVAADEPALFYRDVASAENDLEVIDVRNGVYTAAYGPNGEIYHISEDSGVVSISREAGAENKPDELKKVLERFLSAVGETIPESEDIGTLLNICERYVQ